MTILSNTVYIHDTWDYSNHTMTWGGSYSGMQLRSVSIVNLQGSPSVTTGRATNVAMNSATLNGIVNPNGIIRYLLFSMGLNDFLWEYYQHPVSRQRHK